MYDFLVVMVLLISSVVGMSQATATGEFLQCFSGWAKADQVKVSCNNTLIAQYCDQSCRNINKPGVSLEKGSNGVCLSITNSSYDSWSCEAKAYIDGDEQAPETFTVHVCNQSTSPSPNPVSTSTSPNPGNIESQLGTNAAVVSVPIICSLVIGLIFFILYMKKNPDQEPDIEKGENKNFL